MDDFTKLMLMYGIIPIISSIGAYFMKSMLLRLKDIEKDLSHKVDEQSVRQLLADKIDPIADNVADLKGQVDKILDLLLSKKQL